MSSLFTTNRLRYALNEFYVTEQTYVNDLANIITGYKRPLEIAAGVFPTNAADAPPSPQLKAMPGCFTPAELSALFMNIEDIHSLHCWVLHELETKAVSRVTSVSTVTTRSIFLEQDAACMVAVCETIASAHSQLQDLYMVYFKGYPTAEELVSKHLRLNPDSLTAALLKQLQADLRQMMSLDAYIVKPIQRLLKYPLLFREMQGAAQKIAREILDTEASEGVDGRATADSEAQGTGLWCWRASLERAKSLIEALANTINEARREVDEFDAVVKGTVNWPVEVLTLKACGRLLLESSVRMLKRNFLAERVSKYWSDTLAYRDRHVLLFENVVVICSVPSISMVASSSSATHQRFKLSIPVHKIQVRQTIPDASPTTPKMVPLCEPSHDDASGHPSWTDNVDSSATLAGDTCLSLYNMASHEGLELFFLTGEQRDAFQNTLLVLQLKHAFQSNLTLTHHPTETYKGVVRTLVLPLPAPRGAMVQEDADQGEPTSIAEDAQAVDSFDEDEFDEDVDETVRDKSISRDGSTASPLSPSSSGGAQTASVAPASLASRLELLSFRRSRQTQSIQQVLHGLSGRQSKHLSKWELQQSIASQNRQLTETKKQQVQQQQQQQQHQQQQQQQQPLPVAASGMESVQAKAAYLAGMTLTGSPRPVPVPSVLVGNGAAPRTESPRAGLAPPPPPPPRRRTSPHPVAQGMAGDGSGLAVSVGSSPRPSSVVDTVSDSRTLRVPGKQSRPASFHEFLAKTSSDGSSASAGPAPSSATVGRLGGVAATALTKSSSAPAPPPPRNRK